MTLDEFRQSVANAQPPAGLTLALAGLWWDAKGDWTRAHESAQQDDRRDGSWVHAYTTTLNFNINDQPQTTPNQPVWIVVSYIIHPESGHFAADWLKRDNFGQKIIDPATREVFPHLKVFWEKVSGLTEGEATVFLQGQLETSSRGTLSFFGIPVERGLAISAGPIVYS